MWLLKNRDVAAAEVIRNQGIENRFPVGYGERKLPSEKSLSLGVSLSDYTGRSVPYCRGNC
ncbi:MAG: hypothetical protein GVY04_22965 [Cyanobacteria bacterium]|nr:hypothetical protein [Cyanobacteria bacterium GSL.Bin1]